MGQGCNSGCSNYFQQLTPDTGVKYTGPSIPALGICTGDTLAEVDAVILQKIIDYATGVGIEITGLDLTGCDCFTNAVTCCGTCTDLNCILQAYADCMCKLYTQVQTLTTKVNSMYDGPYVTGCLSNVTSADPFPVIFQELLNEYCNLLAAFNVLNTTVKGFTLGINTTIGNFLYNAITACTGSTNVTKHSSGSSLQISFQGFTPIGGIIPYAGPLTGKVDATGLGLANTDMCGWALCNGNNGTINMMGQVPMGSMQMGGKPPSNTGYVTTLPIGSQVGEAAHILSVSEMPAHGHTTYVPINGANLGNVTVATGGAHGGSVGGFLKLVNGVDPNVTFPVYGNFPNPGLPANVAINGGSQPHTNVQPSTILYYIQRLS